MITNNSIFIYTTTSFIVFVISVLYYSYRWIFYTFRESFSLIEKKFWGKIMDLFLKFWKYFNMLRLKPKHSIQYSQEYKIKELIFKYKHLSITVFCKLLDWHYLFLLYHMREAFQLKIENSKKEKKTKTWPSGPTFRLSCGGLYFDILNDNLNWDMDSKL